MVETSSTFLNIEISEWVRNSLILGDCAETVICRCGSSWVPVCVAPALDLVPKTARGDLRSWSSLDRLVRTLREAGIVDIRIGVVPLDVFLGRRDPIGFSDPLECA